MRFDGVVFDLDGTLVDTLEDLADSMNRVLIAQRFPVHDYAAYKLMVGRGLRQLVSDAIPAEQRDERSLSRCLDLMRAEYRTHCLDKTCPYEGITELLSALRGDGVRLAVLSNKPHDLTQLIVEELIGSSLFEVVMGAQADLPLKPDPTVALAIAERLGASPSRIAYLGDSATDMLTATGAGMIAVGASWGFRGEDELRQGGAQVVIGDPLELLALRAAPGD
jgi:phosphoglycolate phosphatase